MNTTKNLSEQVRAYEGEVEIEIRDRSGNLVDTYKDKNLVKIFAKEILAHCIAPPQIWDPTANSGAGGYTNSGISTDFFPKYILLGASFDVNGQPLDVQDTRYYVKNTSTNSYIPIKPDVGADNGGDLINPIPINEPLRPLKRIETISFNASYQPTDTPLLADDVRAINNVLVMETVLQLDEYNGFSGSGSDFFTITEVALAGGKQIASAGACELTPQYLFLEGINDSTNDPIPCTTSGTSTISILSDVSSDDVNRIIAGDQIMITSLQATSGTESYGSLNQVQPYYLVTGKLNGGRDITLDRTPVDSSGNPLSGTVGVFRSSLRLFSQKILSIPLKKSSDYEITIRWMIYFA